MREGAALLFQECLGYARTLTSRNLVTLPPDPVSPLLEEHTTFAVGRTEHHQRAVRDGKHGPYCVVKGVLHAGGFVHYQESCSAEPSYGLLRTGQRDDAGAVF